MRTACRQLFVEAEGVELMVLILKQRQQVRFGALKAVVGHDASSEASVPKKLSCCSSSPVSMIAGRAAPCRSTLHHGCMSAIGAWTHHNAGCTAQDFACTRCPQACERFVDVLGLKILFSIFMGKSKVRCTAQRSQVSGMLCMTLRTLRRHAYARLLWFQRKTSGSAQQRSSTASSVTASSCPALVRGIQSRVGMCCCPCCMGRGRQARTWISGGRKVLHACRQMSAETPEVLLLPGTSKEPVWLF